MLNHFLRSCFAARLLTQLLSRWIGFGIVIGLLSACTATPQPQIDLSLQVTSSGRPGVYVVTGTTNLPESSRLTIAGIRYLATQTAPTAAGAPNANYSILARQTTEVVQGKWQATLNLWQIAPDGRFQEAWQLNQTQLGFSQQPADKVVFMATFEPNIQLPTIRDQFGTTATVMDSTLTRFSLDGQRYLQVSQTLPVSLPTGKTTSPGVTAADLNGGWGDRANLEPPKSTAKSVNLQAPTEEQTTAPLDDSELLR